MNTRLALNSMEMAEAVLTAAGHTARSATRETAFIGPHNAILASVAFLNYLDAKVATNGGSPSIYDLHDTIRNVIARCLPGGRP